MGFEKTFPCWCPSCFENKMSRVRDIGKLCSSCNMKKIEKEHRHKKLKPNKPTIAEYSKKSRTKHKDNFIYRLNKIVQQSKARAKRKNIEHSIDLEFILSIYPKDGLCPVLKTLMMFNSNGIGGFRDSSPSIDRVDSSKGYTKENVQVISTRANILKSNATLDEIEALYLFMKS